MKLLPLIPLLSLTACAPHAHPPASKPASPPSGRPVATTKLRTGELLREYRFGRFIDPTDPLVMHESHPVYRVESTAQWDLQPGAAIVPFRVTASAPSVAANDAVVAEVNKQRTATRAVLEQTATLNQRLGEMAQAAAQTREIAQQNAVLTREVAGLRERLETIAAERHERAKAAAGPVEAASEDKW